MENNPRAIKRNLLIVLDANNNLKSEAFKTINDIEASYDADFDSEIYVYLRSHSDESVLIKIKQDNNVNRIISDTVEVFKNTISSAGLIGEVAYKVQKLSPAPYYGIILWSHGTSWFPANERFLTTRSFGDDNGKNIDIVDLATSLPKNYEFIMFDACNMASLEVMFEFKDNCKYFLASPTEILKTGFPYRHITKDLMAGDLHSVAEKYYQYYFNYVGSKQSATVSLVETKELEILATMVSASVRSNKNSNLLKRTHVQRMDFSEDFPVQTFDFSSYLKENFPISTYELLQKQIEKTVKFKRNTPFFLGNKLNVFSGLTCYIPQHNDRLSYYYLNLKWVTQSQMHLLLN